MQDFELTRAWCGLVKSGWRIKLLANKPFATLIEDMNDNDYFVEVRAKVMIIFYERIETCVCHEISAILCFACSFD